MKYTMLLFFVAVLSLAPSIAISATPIIVSVNGETSKGQTLTISGSNLCDENNANWWEQFKKPGTSGFEGSDFSADGYNAQKSGSGVSFGYDSYMFIDGSKSGYFQITGAHTNAENPRSSIWINSDGGNDVYMRVYARWTGTDWPSEWYKFIWNKNYNGIQPSEGSFPPSKWRVEYLGDGHYFDMPFGVMSRNRWYCIELRYKLSSPQNLTAWVDGIQLVSASGMSDLGIEYPELGIINLNGTNSSFIGRVNVDCYVYANSRVYPKSSIEITNSSNYASATKRYQYPQFLSNEKVKIECDLTGLGPGPYYLWVTNNRQERSQAYSLGINSSAPSVPQNLTITP
jgi:hypothetical protein